MAATMTKISIEVPHELHKQAKIAATLQDTNISSIVRVALQDYVQSAWTENPHIQKLLDIQNDIDNGRRTLHQWSDVRGELRAKLRAKREAEKNQSESPE